MDSSTKKLINKSIKGNQASCKSLYEKFMPYCYGVLLRYGVQKKDIKDHLQIIFSEIFLSLSSFDESKANFKTWITRICINKTLEQRRKNSRRLTVLSLVETDQIYQYDQKLESGIDKEYMYRILNKMPHQYSSVFNMFVIDGYTHKEIAEKLGITEGSSRVILKRGRKWAKKSLSNFLLTT